MPGNKYVVRALLAERSNLGHAVADKMFGDLNSAIDWAIAIGDTYGLAGSNTVSNIEIIALDEDENMHIFTSTDPNELNALRDERQIR